MNAPTATPVKSHPEPTRLGIQLVMKNATQALAFYSQVFGAKEVMRLVEPSGRLGHAELSLGGVTLAIADEYPEFGILGPESRGGATSLLNLSVDDVDAMAERAIAAGAVLERPITNEFYGDRVAHVRDPYGHRWSLSKRIEDVSFEEMKQRFARMVGG